VLVISRVYLLRSYREEIITSTAATFVHTVEVLDTQIQELKTIASSIQNDSRLRYIFLDLNISTPFDVKLALQNLDYPNDLVSRIVYFYRDTQRLYSAESPFSIDTFLGYVSSYQNWTREEFVETLMTIDTPRWRPAEPVTQDGHLHRNVVTLLMPVPVSGATPQGTVLFQIDDATIGKYLRASLTLEGSSVYLIDFDGHIISSFGDPSSESQIRRLLKSELILDHAMNPAWNGIVREAGREYLVVTRLSDSKTQWYAGFVPLDEAIRGFSARSTRFHISVFLTLLIGFGIVFGFSYHSYRPIQSLSSLAKRIVGAVPTARNDIDIVRYAIQNLAERNQFNDEKTARLSTKRHQLLRLLNGGYETIEAYNRDVDEPTRMFEGNSYIVFVTSIEHAKDVVYPDFDEIIDAIESSLRVRYSTSGFEGIDGLLVFIASTDTFEQAVFEGHMFSVLDILHDRYHVSAAVGVGEPCESIRSLQPPYLEATAALDLQRIKGRNTVIFFREIISAPAAYASYPHREIEAIEDRLHHGDALGAEEILRDICTLVKDRKTSFFLAKAVCSDILGILMREVYINRRRNGSIQELSRVLSVARYTTVDELSSMLIEISREIRSLLSEEDTPNDLMSRVIMFIDTEYISYDFSIQQVADRFGVSVSNLSHQFRNRFSTTISAYVCEKRMEKAKELLSQTDLPLRSLVRDIGYHDTSSFIKKFKQHTGHTPGEYRRVYMASAVHTK